MKSAFLLTVLLSFAGAAQAAEPTCAEKAAEKKLAGAARTSFLGKCEKDAKAVCETAATEKKLAGAARNSFVKKCVGDAVGG